MKQLEFQAIKGVKVEAKFDTPEMTSDFGTVLLREIENNTNIISNFSSAIDDRRHQSYTDHSVNDIISQRVYQICQGYEDADDCDHFRGDAAFKTAVGRHPELDGDLSSQPTMSRLENKATVRDLLRCGYTLVENYLNTFSEAPKSIVLDMDPTSSHFHGHQQMMLFNAYEDEYCLMPFHVYDGLNGKLITTVIRPGKTPLAGEIISVLKRIIKRIRERFPNVLIVFRADSHHSKPEVHEWCEENRVDFVIGQSPNSPLDRKFKFAIEQAKLKYKNIGSRTCRYYASGYYQASTWAKP